MSSTARAACLLALLAALGVAATGCGSDDEETTAPSISVPPGESQTVPEATTTQPTATQPSGGTGTKTKPTAPEDSATNDTPPPPGSPQERFEKACEQNPAACG